MQTRLVAKDSDNVFVEEDLVMVRGPCTLGVEAEQRFFLATTPFGSFISTCEETLEFLSCSNPIIHRQPVPLHLPLRSVW